MHAHILPREKWWWVGLALLLTLAGWLYLRGYNLSLPYIDHVDEPQHLLAAQHLIDDGTARAVFQEAAPPGMSRLNYLLLKHLKPAEAHPGIMLPALRLITIVVWILLVVVIALLGHMLAHPITGLMAAAIWTVNPWVVHRAHFALPDGYLTFFTLLAVWMALIGALHRRRGFGANAIYFVMLATVFKTQAILVAPLVLLMPLAGFRRSGFRPADAGNDVFWNVVRFAVFLFWLLLIHPTLEISEIPHIPVQISQVGLPRPDVIWINLSQVLLMFQPLSGWLGTLLISLSLWRFRDRLDATVLAAILLTALAWLLGISAFGKQGLRQFFALGATLALLHSLALTGLFFAGKEVLGQLKQFLLGPQARELLLSAIFAILIAIGLSPAYRRADALAHNFTLHDRRNDLMRYMDTSVPPGKYISDYDNHKTFNRAWGGYAGRHDFPWHEEYTLLTSKPIADWRELGVEYAIMPHAPLLEDPNIYYPDQTTVLKAYPPDPNFRGPDMVVLRLYPIQHPHDGQLGPIRLLGYDINATQLRAGDDLVFRHYWQADSPTASPHHVYNHLLDATGAIVAQADYVPLWDNRRDTTTWDDPDEIMLGREFTLSTPPDLAPGVYQLVSGLYDPLSWGRLHSPTGQDSLLIATISVQAPAP